MEDVCGYLWEFSRDNLFLTESTFKGTRLWWSHTLTYHPLPPVYWQSTQFHTPLNNMIKKDKNPLLYKGWNLKLQDSLIKRPFWCTPNLTYPFSLLPSLACIHLDPTNVPYFKMRKCSLSLSHACTHNTTQHNTSEFSGMACPNLKLGMAWHVWPTCSTMINPLPHPNNNYNNNKSIIDTNLTLRWVVWALQLIL